jgi:dissimilatory sulfite reductase (desulfoviridin) alpha/beta subunit
MAMELWGCSISSSTVWTPLAAVGPHMCLTALVAHALVLVLHWYAFWYVRAAPYSLHHAMLCCAVLCSVIAAFL